MPETQTLMDGRVRLYQRPRSRLWQCATYFDGKEWRTSTRQESLSRARDFATDWYLELLGQHRSGGIKSGKTFAEAAAKFVPEYELLTQGQRNARYVKQHGDRLRVHLIPFFGDTLLSEITSGMVQDYRVHRTKTSSTGKPPARSTLHHEIVTLRQVFKAAQRHGWIEHIPDFSPPYRASGKVVHRAWFSPEEYKKLYEATRRRAQPLPLDQSCFRSRLPSLSREALDSRVR